MNGDLFDIGRSATLQDRRLLNRPPSGTFQSKRKVCQRSSSRLGVARLSRRVAWITEINATLSKIDHTWQLRLTFPAAGLTFSSGNGVLTAGAPALQKPAPLSLVLSPFVPGHIMPGRSKGAL
jgi:hypothetical protein